MLNKAPLQAAAKLLLHYVHQMVIVSGQLVHKTMYDIVHTPESMTLQVNHIANRIRTSLATSANLLYNLR